MIDTSFVFPLPFAVQSMREGTSTGLLTWIGLDGGNGSATGISLFLILVIGVIVIANMQAPLRWRPLRKSKRKTQRGTPIRAHTSIRQRRVRRRDRRNRGQGYSVRRGTRVED